MKNLILAVLLTAAGTLSAQSKIGQINSLELLSIMPEVKQADSTLQTMANELQSLYNAYVTEYQTKVTDYNNNIGVYSEIKLEMMKEEIEGLQKRISDFETTSQQKIEDKKQAYYAPILDKANAAISKVGKDQKFTCIIDTSVGAVIYMGEDMVDVLPLVKKELGIN